jgi:hypothetical protein
MTDRAQTKACYVTGGGGVPWTLAMIMPGGKPLEKPLSIEFIFGLQKQLSDAAEDLARQQPEKYFQK